MSLEKAAREVLCHFPLSGVRIVSQRGGFSGAAIWRVTALNDMFCLRAWPSNVTASSLAAIHRLMLAAKNLPFVPKLIAGRHYQTVFVHSGRLWDLTTWMPGSADFWSSPTSRKIDAACAVLAQLHVAWGCRTDWQSVLQPCPAIERRRVRWRAWNALVERGWTPSFDANDPVGAWAERAWKQLALQMPTIPARLSSWLEVNVPLQPCLCDIWHDHVLFTDDEVTGLIDFGSVKTDNVAVDLARMLGSMVADDEGLREAGLAAYQKIRPLRKEECDLVSILDETGIVLAAANWLRWLYHEKRQYADRVAVAERIAALVRRMESWQ